MQLFPTRPTVHLALASLGVVTAGVILRSPAVFGWGGGLVFGLALARASAMISVLRARSAGLEMVWRTDQKVRRVARGSAVTVEIELKNRDRAPVGFAALRAVHSSELEVTIEPTEGIIEAHSSAIAAVTIHAPRVGRYCLHGLAFEVRGTPGLFEAPLAFANPIGIEVFPRPLLTAVSSARGGRSRRRADEGARAKVPGEGSALYELREHVSGDPFKRIAWRASARRGKLMVREFEREDRDIVWLIVDSAVELLAGPLGSAPLDRGIDEMAAIAARHLGRGDRVGVATLATPPVAWMAPGTGPARGMEIARTLVDSVSMLDDDRSDYDEFDVARRALDHLRFLDASRVAEVRGEDLEAIRAHADAERARAPYDLPPPLAKTARERALRQYLLCYGISSPPRLGQGRERSLALLVHALDRAVTQKPRPSLVYVFSPPPEAPSEALSTSIRKLRRRGVTVNWITAREEPTLAMSGEFARVISDAVGTRVRINRERGERLLHSIGVSLVHPGRGRGA